jgi:hypothetical protein
MMPAGSESHPQRFRGFRAMLATLAKRNFEEAPADAREQSTADVGDRATRLAKMMKTGDYDV